MITQTMTYKDFDGLERTETFYFNMTEAEIMNWQNSVSGGMSARIEKIAKANDAQEVLRLLMEVIDKSYGVKSPDGRRFVKNEEVLEEFKSTQVYSDFCVWLLDKPENALDFLNRLIPEKLQKAAAEAAQNQTNAVLMPAT